MNPKNIKLNYSEIGRKSNSYAIALKELRKIIDCKNPDDVRLINALYGYVQSNYDLWQSLKESRKIVRDFMKQEKKKIDDAFMAGYPFEPVKVDENR